MNQSLTARKIPIKRGKISSLKSKTLNQNGSSMRPHPRSKYRSSFTLSSLSSTPRNRTFTNNNTDSKKISRISNLSSPRQTITPLSTRFAANETRRLYELYTILKQNYHAFSFDVPDKLFDCEFSRQFTRFTTTFDCFSRQLACAYGTVNPKNVITNTAPMITSSLHQATKSLMSEWIDFIERLNSISETGISPHISMTNSNLTILFQNLATISTIILVDKFKGDEAGQTVKSICAICIKIKDILVAEYSKPKSQRFSDFNISTFEDDCRRCSQLTAALFEQNLPPNSFTLTEMLAIRSGIINSMSVITQILRSAMHFEDRIMNLKKSIIEFNSELNRVETGANLQFQVELSLEETQTDLLGDFESLEKENDAQEEEEVTDAEEENESAKDEVNFHENNEIEEKKEIIDIVNKSDNDKEDNENKEDNDDSDKGNDNDKDNNKEDNNDDNDNDNDKEDNENKEDNDNDKEDNENKEDNDNDKEDNENKEDNDNDKEDNENKEDNDNDKEDNENKEDNDNDKDNENKEDNDNDKEDNDNDKEDNENKEDNDNDKDNENKEDNDNDKEDNENKEDNDNDKDNENKEDNNDDNDKEEKNKDKSDDDIIEIESDFELD